MRRSLQSAITAAPLYASISGEFIAKRRGPNSVSVNVDANVTFKYTLSIYAYPNETAEEVIKGTTDERKFPFTVQLQKKAVSYRFKLFVELPNRDYGGTIWSYLLEEEGLPNEVEGAEIKAETSEYSPIRWKLERSPYTIYAEELCGTTYDLSYDLRLYWAEERYQVFISAATSKGYGPEKRLDVAIGSPPGFC
ncbi:unnamed protein product [Nippostrongylus brasiliensis]|uniref:PLAT domain-containing protein n=1 Tax=Nippostrongylus brasiliensis TaxID=27835 RepID=A0A158R3C0_NIPBR|nr:unnamed protein product [Nippostrongylus brasiliensis]